MHDGKPFDTNSFFSGGAGMFIEYHDIIKPVKLYAILKMIITDKNFGLPIEMISSMTVFSMIEWYMHRKYINPLKCLDPNKCLDNSQLDVLLQQILDNDTSIYTLAPTLNIYRMLSVYKKHHMTFPIYIYSKHYESNILHDCNNIFNGIQIKYTHGDIKDAIKECDNNFTYIISDIELVNELSKLLMGSCSHILVPNDYRYNYIDNYNNFKYDLNHLCVNRPYTRIGIINAMDKNQLVMSFSEKLQGGNENVTG